MKEMKEQQCFKKIIEKSEEKTFEFTQNAATFVWFWLCTKLETHKIANLLGDTGNQSSKFETKNGVLSKIKITQTMMKEMKVVQPLNLKPKLLNQIFVIIQIHIFM